MLNNTKKEECCGCEARLEKGKSDVIFNAFCTCHCHKKKECENKDKGCNHTRAENSQYCLSCQILIENNEEVEFMEGSVLSKCLFTLEANTPLWSAIKDSNEAQLQLRDILVGLSSLQSSLSEEEVPCSIAHPTSSFSSLCPICKKIQRKVYPSSNEEADADYIIFNLRQAIKHEIEGTNIGGYKDDVKKYTKELKNFIRTTRLEAQRSLAEEYSNNIGMLRQWLNEDRITDPKKMITNEDIKHWLKITE